MTTIAQYETGMSWAPIVEAAGMLSVRHHPEVVYMLAGAIMADQEVKRRHALKSAQYQTTDACRNSEFPALIPPELYVQVLREMTSAERQALAIRIQNSRAHKQVTK